MLIFLSAVIAFVGMEAFSWAFHKYVMHGPLWSIHQTHHIPQKGFFELNDIFSLLFGLAAAAAIYFGLDTGNDIMAGMGFGVTGYGLVYFILHDVAVHGRIRSRYLSRLAWLSTIRRAHKIHHKYLQKNPGRSYGLLFVKHSVFNREDAS